MPDIALVNALKKRFITRADVKAIQTLDGEYRPVRRGDDLVPWSNDDLVEHLDRTQTYGHYMLNTASQCKLFAFDVDFVDAQVSLGVDEDDNVIGANAREAWSTRKHPSRPWMKRQLRLVAEDLSRKIHEELNLELAVAYSGNKGIHVYGFTGKRDASNCIEGARIVTDLLGGWAKHPEHPMLWVWDKYPIFTFEIFPKQAKLTGSGFGNLMRLPLGRNWKAPNDPTFFVDLTAPLATLKPADSLWALTDGAKNPWKAQGE